ncbi:DUF3533 domain-containing protein [Leekyejoonella antrihumi]|uniref:DUF3533 domain-containing protein n=1 Tax=Leekyejoonella antrihumi TaxID=1660198 RepID=A0A563E122_9MICO|nr:DUF3533 domain-containing protein [Leekyejoonella antrihumi]TWP36069.1 DUF3533 domain-containing protein [Leekyejoonella antrihumi]
MDDDAHEDTGGPDEPYDAPRERRRRRAGTIYGPADGYERSRDEPMRSRLKDVLGPRTIGLLIGAILVQFGFIASYVGAFHDPQPHALTVTVVASHGWQGYVSNELNAVPGKPVWAYASTDEASAKQNLKDGKRQAVYLFNRDGTKDTLLVNSAEGSSITAAMETIFHQVATKKHRTLAVNDVVPVQKGDERGLTSFYLVVGWLVGGYLMASLLGIRKGPKARNFRRVLWRLFGCLAYACLSGLGGAWIVGPLLGALTGHFWAMAGIGMLLSMCASIFTMGMEALFGIIGVGVSIVLFVVLGNPSAGGAFGYQLLPTFWRVIGPWLPNGAGVDSVRSVVYLGGTDIRFHLAVIAWWLVVGLLALLLVSNNTYWGFTQKRPVSDDQREPEGMDARS